MRLAEVRALLAVGFIPPGLTKLLGHRFTTLPTSTPVGYFFDAFFQADLYYRFVGLAQLAAGLLLLFRATAALGAVVYFPILLNIFVITVAVGFRGTPFVVGAMLVGNLYLLCWDYDRWKALLPGAAAGAASSPSWGERHLGVVPTVALGLAALGAAVAAALALRAVQR